MKIRKVEIEAFRAFDQLTDSTFDFTLPDKSIANFVSIYAPNGYGKTSFYDAVEWGVTGQIARFRKNAPENKKVSRENRKHNKNQFLLQHNGQSKLGFVKVIPDSSKITFRKKNITTRKVYDFSNEGDNLYFKNVILSQELIDSFIKMDKAEDRYKEFMKNIPSLNKYNIGLQNIIRLSEKIEEELTGLKANRKELEQKRLDFDFEGDNKILEEINKSIAFLKENKEELKIIEKQYFTENELAVLTQKVKARISGINTDMINLNSKIEAVEKAFNGSDGNENEIGVVSYYSFREKIDALRNEKLSFENYLKLIKDKTTFEKSILELTKNLDRIIKSNTEILKIKNQYNSFEKLKEQIELLKKEKEEANQTLHVADKEKRDLSRLQDDVTIELEKLNAELVAYKTISARIPSVTLRINEIDKLKEETSKEIKKIISDLSLNKEKLFPVDESIKEITFYSGKLKEEDFEALKECSYLKGQDDNLSKVLGLIATNKELKSKLKKTISKINIQKNLNSELESLISKGLEIIGSNGNNICPLCSASYDSYKDLSDSITNNPLLEDVLKESLKEKTLIEKELNDHQTNISEITQFFENELNSKLQLEIKNKHNLIGKIEKNNLLIEGLNNKLSKLNNENQSLITFLGNLSLDEFQKQNDANIQLISGKINELKKKNEVAVEGIKTKNSILEKSLKLLEGLDNDIKSIETSELYKLVTVYFNQVLKTNTIGLNVLDSKIDEIEKEEVLIKEQIVDERNKLEASQTLLKDNNLTFDQLEAKIKLIYENIDQISKSIKNFEVYIEGTYKIDLSHMFFEEASKSFEQKKKNIRDKLDIYSEILKHYQIVEKLKDDSYKFLVSENTKANIDKLKKKAGSLVGIKKKLAAEKDSLENFLKKAVDNFFYTDIINSIYSKIDPHPDYDRIEFDCDFKEKNPRLQIYTIDKDGKKSTPALYFSSAQINILSLSVFLARALKTVNPKTNETVKCIFVDDPIQSMDSINILSFIDLFRSLTVNLDRQIIVSTHEENFHLLLQKKIPKKLFKSKFIQFETFGKVRQEE